MTTFRLRLLFYAMIYNQDTREQGWKHGLPVERLLNLNHDPIEYFEKDMMGCFHGEKKVLRARFGFDYVLSDVA